MDKESLEEIKRESQKQLKNFLPEHIIPYDNYKNKAVEEKYTIVAIPKKETIEKIETWIEELKKYDESQYYYSPEQLHITLFGEISTSLDPKLIVQSVNAIREKYTIHFRLEGIGSNYFVSSILAYPQNFSMSDLRKDLRALLGQQGTDYTKHLSVYESIGWINYMRFAHKPTKEFIHILQQNMNRDFGIMVPEKLELYKVTGKMINDGKSELLHVFS